MDFLVNSTSSSESPQSDESRERQRRFLETWMSLLHYYVYMVSFALSRYYIWITSGLVLNVICWVSALNEPMRWPPRQDDVSSRSVRGLVAWHVNVVHVCILLQRHKAVVVNFITGNFGLFYRKPWQPLAEPQDLAENRLRNTALNRQTYQNTKPWALVRFLSVFDMKAIVLCMRTWREVRNSTWHRDRRKSVVIGDFYCISQGCATVKHYRAKGTNRPRFSPLPLASSFMSHELQHIRRFATQQVDK